jgi:branched-chain amino acid aminotransferase
MKPWSKTWTFLDGDWHEGNVPIMGARTHAAWAGTSVFDGARAFEGVTPDLDLHCAHVNRSAATMMLAPLVSVEEWIGLARDGVAKFAPNAELYLRPFYWAEGAGFSSVVPGADSTRWCLTIYEAALAKPDAGISVTLSPYRRPTPDSALLEAKAGCLYPNNARAMVDAHARGFDNCIMLDQEGMSRNWRSPICSWRKTARCSRPRRTAPSSTASRASGSSRYCAATASSWTRPA